MEEKNYRAAGKDFSAVGLTMVIGTVVFIGVQYLAVWLYDLAVGDAPGNYNVMLLAELIPTYLFTMPFMIWLLKKLPGEELARHKMSFWQFLGALAGCFGIMVSCNIIGLLLTGGIGLLIKKPVDNQVLGMIGQLNPLVSLVFVSTAAPIFEELIFRKMLVTRVVKYGEGTAIFLSGLMFGLFHGNLNQFAYAFGLGAFLAFLYLRTGDIRVTIGMHMIVNFSTSVVGSELIGHMDMQRYLEVTKAGDIGGMTQYIQDHLAVVLLLILYLVLEYGLAIAGVVLLIVCRKKLVLKPRECSLEKGKRLRTIFGNIGIPMFCVVWAAMIVLQLFGLR